MCFLVKLAIPNPAIPNKITPLKTAKLNCIGLVCGLGLLPAADEGDGLVVERGDGDGLDVGRGEGDDGWGEGVGEGVEAGVGDGVTVGAGVGDGDGVSVGSGVGDGTGVGVGSGGICPRKTGKPSFSPALNSQTVSKSHPVKESLVRICTYVSGIPS